MEQVQELEHVLTGLSSTTYEDDCLPACHDAVRMLRINRNRSVIRYVFAIDLFRWINPLTRRLP